MPDVGIRQVFKVRRVNLAEVNSARFDFYGFNVKSLKWPTNFRLQILERRWKATVISQTVESSVVTDGKCSEPVANS
jgi:hypothetical protein